MKYLAVFLLVGLGFASAYTSDFDGTLSADSVGWITDRMRDSLQIMIDGFEKALKEGKTISQRAFKKAEEMYQQLLDWGIDVGEEIKEAFERIREEMEKNRNTLSDNPMHVGGWITDRMRDSLQVMIDGFEQALKEGKTISKRAFKKAEEMYQQLLDWGIDVGEEIKEAFERIREEMEKNRNALSDNPMQVGGWITDRMRDSLQVMIDGFEQALKEGKTISKRAFKKAEEMYQQLLDWGIDVGEEIKEAFERIREEMEKNRNTLSDNPMQVGGWITDRMRDSLQVMIDGFEQALKEGKTISKRAFKKAEEMYQQLLDWGIDVGEEIKEAFERIREEMEKNRNTLSDNPMQVGGWITDRMRDSLQVMIDGFEQALKEGKTISKRAFKKAEEMYQQLLDWGIDVGEEIKEALERIREEMEKNRSDIADNPMHVGDWITDRLRDSFQVMIDEFEKAMKEGKTIRERAFKKAEDLYQKLLDWGVDVGEEIKEAFERIREYVEKGL